MNPQAIQILFLKDLFLCRWALFGYLLGGLISSGVMFLPGENWGFIGFILVVTISIASGIHLIGSLLLSESIDQTRNFVMSLPVSLLDYSIAKIAVVLASFLIPWCTMLACLSIGSFIVPGAKAGLVAVLPVLFLFLLATFSVQLVTAVITGSIGWTICMVVFCNVLFNLFSKNLFGHPEVSELIKRDTVQWATILGHYVFWEVLVIVISLSVAFYFQSRSRDLI